MRTPGPPASPAFLGACDRARCQSRADERRPQGEEPEVLKGQREFPSRTRAAEQHVPRDRAGGERVFRGQGAVGPGSRPRAQRQVEQGDGLRGSARGLDLTQRPQGGPWVCKHGATRLAHGKCVVCLWGRVGAGGGVLKAGREGRRGPWEHPTERPAVESRASERSWGP